MITSAPCQQPPSIDRHSRIYGCWIGKSIGGTLGLPAEGKMERLSYNFYDPVPTIAPPNDDLELQLVWLELVEHSNEQLTREDFAQAWLRHIHYMWDEYGRCRWNLRRGVPVSAVGTYENWFQSGMGSPIRSEIWACLFPDDPASAAYYAALDASLDHGVEGIAGEVLFAVLQNLVASGVSILDAIKKATTVIPGTSQTASAVNLVLSLYKNGCSVWNCREKLLDKYGHENFTHAPLNVALTLWALAYGNGNFEESVLLAVNGGYDTDCTAATVGATIGLALGSEGIPIRWSRPIGEGIYVGPGIIGITPPQTLRELAQRTISQIGRLKPKSWNDLKWECPATKSIANFPGTISLKLPDSTVSWSNGELPNKAKRAGVIRWEWATKTDVERYIICLSRFGAKLYLDNKLILNCPAGLPFVPATHRSPTGSRVRIAVEKGTHQLRLELGSSDAQQEVSVILAYLNLHICPWTTEELPFEALLPVSI